MSEPSYEFGFEEIAAALFAAKGIESGLWRVAAKLRFAGATAGFVDAKGVVNLPTAMVGIEGLALFPVTEPAHLVFDAATGKAANVPAKRAAAKPGAKSKSSSKGSKVRAKP